MDTKDPPGRLWPALIKKTSANKTLFLFFVCLFFFASAPVAKANTYEVIDRLFLDYDQTLDHLIAALDTKQWPDIQTITKSLTQQSQQFLRIGRRDGNPTWTYYSSNLYHHCLEMERSANEKNSIELFHLAAILLNHIEQIQSSDPYWLRHYIHQQLDILEQGLKTHNLPSVRDSAENIHTSANKIILSISSFPQAYQHTYWKSNIIAINRLGDAIIGEITQGNWSRVSEHLVHIKHVLEKWTDSFNEPGKRTSS